MISLLLLIPAIYGLYFGIRKSNNRIFSKKHTDLIIGIIFFIAMFIFLLVPNFHETEFDRYFRNGYARFITPTLNNVHINNFVFVQKLLLFSSFPLLLVGLKFRDNIVLKLVNVFYTPLVVLINLIGLPYLSYGITGSKDFLVNFNSFGLSISLILLSIIILFFIVHLLDIIKLKLPKKQKYYWLALLTVVSSILITLPNMGLGIIFGYSTFKHIKYSPFHIFLILTSIGLPIICSVILNKTNKEIKEIFLHLLSLSVFIIFFDYFDFNSFSNLTNWPLHLCHTAVMLILISIWFKVKQLFYFTYFVNVLGTLFAIIFPSLSETTSFTSSHGVHFWFQHIGILLTPVIAVSVNFFEKPKLKDLFSQAIIFTIYFILISAINALFPTIANHPVFGNSGKHVDYFFLNGTVLSDQISLLNIARSKSIVTITIKGVKSNIYLLHNLIIYISFITLTFGLISVYKYFYGLSEIIKNIFTKFYYRIKNHKQFARFNYKKEKDSLQKIIPSIKIEHFSKMYAGANFYSVQDFSLEINHGEIFGFIGHNGAGKSTLIKSLVGVNSYDGHISVCGVDMRLNPSKVKFLIGYVPDNHPLYERLTGREYIKYVAKIYMVEKKDYETRLEYYLNLFNLAKDIDRLINTYSHGMKQKVSIIASLIHEPKIWILDEPLTGLDPTSVLMVRKCIENHAKKGNIVFFSSHIIEIVEGICDRIAIIRKGQLMLTDTVSNCIKKYGNLTNLYKQYVLSNND